MRDFVYKKFSNLEEACTFLSQNRDKAEILAGGTDLLVKMKRKLLEPEYMVDIKGIPGLDQIRYHEKMGLAIGALTTLGALEVSEAVRDKFSVISEAAGLVGSVQIRNRGTIGGNICNASPAADMVPCLIALGASAEIAGREGKRRVPLEALLSGSGETVLKRGEILTSVQVPNIPPRTGCAYLKHGIRKAMEMAVVGVAVALTLDHAEDRCQEAKIVLGAVAPIPMRAEKSEGRLRGEKIDEVSIEEASQLASEACTPITDVRASAVYRKEIVRVLTEKAIRQALSRIG